MKLSKRIGPSWLVFIALLSLFLLVVVTFVNKNRTGDRLQFMFPITMESIQFQWLNWGSVGRKETEIRIQPARQMTCPPCSTHKKSAVSGTKLPIIYVITPTYRRPEQMAELVRLAQTLLHVPAIHWIVVEDADSLSKPLIDLLARLPIPSTHLYAPMPTQFRTYKYLKPRGVSNRNAAMNFIRKNVKSGVFYFADDDNSYDIRLFDEMRYTKKVSMWPVGLIPRYGVSSPVLNEDGQVVDFYDSSSTGRMFAVDMASFAVNIQFLLERPNATMPFIAGLEEDGFLQSLNISLTDIEAKANQCTQLNPLADRRMMKLPRFKGTNIDQLQAQII